MARCSKGSCPDEAADDSVQCPKHRDMTRASNQRFQGRTPAAAGKPKRKYTKRMGGGSTAVAVVEPKVVTAKLVRRADLNGNVLTVLESVIGKLSVDLATLQGAKEILERQ